MNSSEPLLLGLDIGTQAVKGLVVTLDGESLARVTVERGPTHPRPGWVEMDAERDWWGIALGVIRRLLSEGAIETERIATVGISGLVPCLCPLDDQGRPLRPAILYSDNRALEELAWVNERAGLSLSAEAVVPKLIWLERHEPATFCRTQTFLSAHNYVVYRLTGAYAMDYDTANIVGGLFDPHRRSWREGLCHRLEISPSLLPPLHPATDVVGWVSPEAAQMTGLREGTPVITGTGDTFPTIVGCGAVEPGDAMLSFGTTGLLTVTRRPLVESVTGPHFESEEGDAAVTWGANVLSAGRLVRWYAEHFAAAEMAVARRTGGSVYDLLEAEAREVPPGAEGLIALPHLLGRRTPTPDPTIRGALLGLTPSHGPAHVYRALLESFAYNIRQGFEPLRPRIDRLVATAGGARSRLWRQLVADVLETPLEYPPGGSGALGIAFIAGYAVGLIEEFTEIKETWLQGKETTAPDATASAHYRRLFPLYVEFEEALAAPFAHLAERAERT